MFPSLSILPLSDNFQSPHSDFIWKLLPPVIGVIPYPEIALVCQFVNIFPQNTEKPLKIS